MLPFTPMFFLCTCLQRILPCALCLTVLNLAQAQAPTQPTTPPVVEPATAPVTTVPDSDADAPEKTGMESKKDKLSPVLRVLPAGLDANPPSPEDLKAENLTWKGEYEATKDGQPVLGPDARPIPVLYNAKGKRVKSKVKPLRSHALTVVAGTLTVDGWTGKARLNYDIPGQDFIYFSTPSTGTVILSQTAFPGSREQKLALDGKTLTVKVDDHEIQLASDNPLAGKKPESVWMRVDPEYRQDPRYPVMGYGAVTKPPYAWPAAKLVASKGATGAPPLPQSMMPAVIAAVCIPQQAKPCAPAGTKSATARRPTAPDAKLEEASSAEVPPATLLVK